MHSSDIPSKLYSCYNDFSLLILLLSFSLHKNTVLSIVDGRVQQYVRQRHHKVFSSSSNANSPSHSSVTTKSKPFMNHQQECINKHVIGSSKTMNER